MGLGWGCLEDVGRGGCVATLRQTFGELDVTHTIEAYIEKRRNSTVRTRTRTHRPHDPRLSQSRSSRANKPPRYTIPKNYHGLTLNQAAKYGVLAAGFGGVAGFFALFFFAEVPKVRDDIMKKIPVLDKFFTNEIPPEDNPF